MILPYIEQTNLYNSIDFSSGLTAVGSATGLVQNRVVAATVVPTYLCPSDDSNESGRLNNRSDVNDPDPIGRSRMHKLQGLCW